MFPKHLDSTICDSGKKSICLRPSACAYAMFTFNSFKINDILKCGVLCSLRIPSRWLNTSFCPQVDLSMSFSQRFLPPRTHKKAIKTMAIISAQITHNKENCQGSFLLLEEIPHFRKAAFTTILTLSVQHTSCYCKSRHNCLYLQSSFSILLGLVPGPHPKTPKSADAQVS